MAGITFTRTLLMFSAIHATMSSISPSVKTFFPDIKGNLTKITWAHAVNNQTALKHALGSDTIKMLEADIIMGTLTTINSTDKIPITGHPPTTESDLSLENFLDDVIDKNKKGNGKKGIKLDFKSIEAFNESLGILDKLRPNMTFPVWLNADILSGPVNATGIPVDASTFLAGASQTFPESTLSIGWTTRYGSKDNITKGNYTLAHVTEMLETISRNKVNQTITYPVRAGIAANDVNLMKTLIANSSAYDATLTIWSSSGDNVDTAKLSTLIKSIGVDKVFVDVPDDVWNALNISASSSIERGWAMATGLALLSLAFWKTL